MSAFGKFLVGIGVAGAVAGATYYMLEQLGEKAKQPVRSSAGGENGDVIDLSESAQAVTDAAKEAADRAYTTIKHGSEEAVDALKEAVGPTGSEVIDVVGETAGKVKDAFVDSAVRVKARIPPLQRK